MHKEESARASVGGVDNFGLQRRADEHQYPAWLNALHRGETLSRISEPP
jgi:hypothetical protein